MKSQRLDFDTAALSTWLAGALGEPPRTVTLTPIVGGQSNPTFFLRFGEHEFVLRKQPSGELLPSAHAVDREYRIMHALRETDVPVPKMVALCQDRTVIGTLFYVMDRLHGRVMSSCAFPEVPVSERAAYFVEQARVLAALHAVDLQATALSDFGKGGNYFARQISRWSLQWAQSKLQENADIDGLVHWLSKNIPTGEITTIVHGDYRTGNVMWHPTEPKIIGVLDWELATLGHPMADLAYSCLPWHSSPNIFHGIDGIDLARQGLISQAEYVQHYFDRSQHRGQTTLTTFHLAFSMFRFAVILEGVAARAKAGNAASADGARVGAQAAAFARRGFELTQSA